MKKLIRIALCLSLCVVSLMFTACGGENKISAPKKDAEVVSNGGILVQKGDYLYFANGYHSIDDIKKSNVDKKYDLGGLYVAKNEVNNSFERDKNGSLTNIDRLSSKLASFEATDLHIFGDYMYYTTVNTDLTKNGKLQTKHLEVYRVKLNGTGSERVYRSKINYVNDNDDRVVTFNYYTANDNVYVLINENGTLKRIVCNDKVGSVKKIEEDVVDVKSSSDNVEDCTQIFYTKVNEDGYYELIRYDIENDKNLATLVCGRKNDEISSILDVKFNNVYLYMTLSDIGTEFLYRVSFDDIKNNTTNFIKLTSTTYNAVYLLENYLDGILVISSNKVEIIDAEKPTSTIELQENLKTSGTIVKLDGGYVYYYDGKNLNRWSYVTDTNELIYKEENTICNYQFEVLNNYLYYYATQGENDYLFRVSLSNIEDKKSEVIGKLNEKDVPEETEED